MSQKTLQKSLGVFQATTLVIGSVMARTLHSGWQLIAIWIFAGILTTLGALTQSEISSRLPVTGGLYAFFREALGDTIGYFYGWANFMIAGSGAIAAIAFIFANYLNDFIPLWHAPEYWQKWAITIPYLGSLYPAANLGEKLVGSVLIFILTALNVRGVKLGSRIQSISASAKL